MHKNRVCDLSDGPLTAETTLRNGALFKQVRLGAKFGGEPSPSILKGGSRLAGHRRAARLAGAVGGDRQDGAPNGTLEQSVGR